MNTNTFKKFLFILFSFYIAIILQIIFYSIQCCFFRPSFILLMLLYWIITLPYKINIGTGFVLGIIFDLILGSTIGVHALAFSIFTYLILLKFLILGYISVYLQSLIVMILSCFNQLVVFLIKILIINISLKITSAVFFISLMDGVIWLFLFILMRKICDKFKIY